jgi:protein O-mannosyl-transferase
VNRWSLSIIISAVILSLAVLVSFSPCLNAGFLNWDDDVNILENPSVRSLTPANLKRIFTESVQKIYIPLTTLSYAVEYQFAGYQPFLFHLDNLILHGLNTFLVFFLACRMGMAPGPSLIAALLFGVHPLKVESVAWATERKDVLYAFFYLIALWNYCAYIEKGSKGRYAWAVAAGLLSVLSKPMALSLPLILCLMDWFTRRPFSRRSWLDKIPFVVTIVPVVWITYAQHVRNPIGNAGEAVLIWAWSFVFYIWKFLAPFVLIPLYRLPQPVSLSNPAFLIPLIIFVWIVVSLFIWRRKRWWLFAVGYYVLSIFFLLRFDVGIDLNVVADRFMYLPCLGFCLAIGHGIDKITQSQDSRGRLVVYVLIALVMICLMGKTFTQSQIWKDPMTIWNYVIAQDPRSHVGYNNRGNIYNESDRLNEAMADYNKALELNPGFARAFNNRGIIYAKAGRNREALEDFNKAVEYKPDFEKAYYNRGVIKERFGQHAEAFADVRKARELGAPVPEDIFIKMQKAAQP